MADKSMAIMVETPDGDVFNLLEPSPDWKVIDFFKSDGTGNDYCVMFNGETLEVYPNMNAAKGMVAFHKSGVDDGDPYDMYHVEVIHREEWRIEVRRALENILSNGVDSLEGSAADVVVELEQLSRDIKEKWVE